MYFKLWITLLSGVPNILKKKKPGFNHHCGLCEKRFMKKTNLIQHIEKVHPEIQVDFGPGQNEVTPSAVQLPFPEQKGKVKLQFPSKIR